ncbi:MAG: 1-acyl-sn-glycerol-3-phosphate acyltransferase [Pseudomonadota bacterium]
MTLLPKIRHPGSRQWLDRFLHGSLAHYSTCLPKRFGGLSGFLLRRLFAGVRFDSHQEELLRSLPPDAVVAFVNKHRSRFEYMLYHTRLKAAGLTNPSIGFNYRVFFLQPLAQTLRIVVAHLIYVWKHHHRQDPYTNGFYEERLLEGDGAFISLVQKHEFIRRFVKSGPDPLRFLLALQQKTDRPVIIIPMLMFYGRTPLPSQPTLVDLIFGPEQKPGVLRRLTTILRKPQKTFFEMSKPVWLKEILQQPDYQGLDLGVQALMLRRDLLKQVNRHRRSITGPIQKTHLELSQDILTGDRLQHFMARYANRRKLSLYKARLEAMNYLDELAARPTPMVVEIGLRLVHWLQNQLFDGLSVNTERMAELKEASLKGPLIILPCHRSHLDSLLVSATLYDNHFSPPLIFAGKNMAFWPMGIFFRRLGAFFVRRSFKGAFFYAMVLSEYIHWILKEGHHVEVFIEGTRSRSGKLMPPQAGMLAMLINAVKDGACQDINLVPVSIGYDRVPEETAYLSEAEGGKKKPESLRGLIGARKLLKRRYGRIYVRFARPAALSDLLSAEGTSLTEMTSKDINRFSRTLGERVMHAISGESVVTPHALAACALLAKSRPAVTRKKISFAIGAYLAHMNSRDIALADTLQMDPKRAIDSALADYIHRKLIEAPTAPPEALEEAVSYRINTTKRTILAYYKNNCINHFVPAALTAVLIMRKESFQFSTEALHVGYGFLADMFAGEFTFTQDHPPAYTVRKTVKAFIDDAILMPHPTLPDTYQLTASGHRKLAYFAGMIRPFLESYWVALMHLKGLKPEKAKKQIDHKHIHATGLQLFKQQRIECSEALLAPNLTNAVEYFNRAGIRSADDAEAIEATETTLVELLQVFSG